MLVAFFRFAPLLVHVALTSSSKHFEISKTGELHILQCNRLLTTLEWCLQKLGGHPSSERPAGQSNNEMRQPDSVLQEEIAYCIQIMKQKGLTPVTPIEALHCGLQVVFSHPCTSPNAGTQG